MVKTVRAWHPDVPLLREVYHARFDHAYPMHAHDDWAMMLVDEGAVDFHLDRGMHHAAPAAVTLLPPGVPHDGRSAVVGSSYRKRVLYLESDWLPSMLQGPAATAPTITSGVVVAAVKRVHSAVEHPGDLMAAEHWLLVAQELALAHLGRPGSSREDAPLARRLRRLLDERLTESFTIAEIGRELGSHPSHLIRVFSQRYGMAPHQYQVSRRVDLARRLLLDGTRPAYVAAEAGFYDQAHLTRHFRRILGVTPGAFAAAAR